MLCTIVPFTGDLFVFGGLWGPWRDPEAGIDHDTATVITTEPNELIPELPHHRMPAILAPSEWATWLDMATSVADLQALLRPAPSEWLGVKTARPKEFALG